MANWFKNGGLQRFVATLGIAGLVTTGIVFGQYSDKYQNNVNPELDWRSPAIHGQQVVQSQAMSQSSVNRSSVQLVQHLEPTHSSLLPTVGMIDQSSTPTVAPPPINGTRVAQVPGSGASPNAYLDTIYPESRSGTPGRPNIPGMTSQVPTPAPNLSTMRDNSYGSIGGADLSTMSPPGRTGGRIVECGDPREIGDRIDTISVLLDIDIKWDLLDPCTINVDDYHGRNWQQTCVQYNAPMLCTSAPYFEDVAVERYGHSWGPFLQPVMSAAHFYGSVIFLPYKMGLTPPCECVYTIGYYRPGSCVPFMIDPIPLSLRAGVAQAGAVVGTAYLIPVQ